jgi:hypothetical protein
MTRLEIHIDELVLRGLPQEYADRLPLLVEQRLTELAQRREVVPSAQTHEPIADVGSLADLVARQVLAQIVTSEWADSPTAGWAEARSADGPRPDVAQVSL